MTYLYYEFLFAAQWKFLIIFLCKDNTFTFIQNTKNVILIRYFITQFSFKTKINRIKNHYISHETKISIFSQLSTAIDALKLFECRSISVEGLSQRNSIRCFSQLLLRFHPSFNSINCKQKNYGDKSLINELLMIIL